jgi:hypothetical protein
MISGRGRERSWSDLRYYMGFVCYASPCRHSLVGNIARKNNKRWLNSQIYQKSVASIYHSYVLKNLPFFIHDCSLVTVVCASPAHASEFRTEVYSVGFVVTTWFVIRLICKLTPSPLAVTSTELVD